MNIRFYWLIAVNLILDSIQGILEVYINEYVDQTSEIQAEISSYSFSIFLIGFQPIVTC